MKKIIAVVIIITAFAAAGFFGYGYFQEKKMTDPSQWKATGTSEFTVNIPESMESSSDLYSVSTGEEQIAFYSNSKAAFSVAKLSYSNNASIKNIDLESYLSNIEINDEKLDIHPVNDGYYYSRQTTSSGVFKDTDELFMIEGMFKGDDAIYSVAIQCRLSDKDDYEEPMLEWLESFKLR